MKLNCLIVDDEPVARKGIAEYVNDIDFLNLVAQCENPLKAMTQFQKQVIDLIFLDVHMPKLSGIDFLKTLTNPPLVILTTAHAEYALEGYSLDVVDYLLKPITFERFFKASQKALEICRLTSMASDNTRIDYFFVKCNNKYEKVFFSEVRFVEALQNYVVMHTVNRKLITYLTLTGLEQQLPQQHFLKVHKSYIIGLAHVTALDGNDILIGNDRIPVSRNLKEEVLSKIIGNNLLKR